MPSGRTLTWGARVEESGREAREEPVSAGELHERHLKDVYAYVLRRVLNPEDAADVTAEVFAAALAGLSRFRGHCPPYLWLLSIARRQIALSWRRRTTRREILASELAKDGPNAAAMWEGLAASPGPETALARAEARQVLGELMARLNADQQEVLLLKYWERLSLTEIAVVMARSPAAVNSLLQRARAILYREGRAYFLGENEGNDHA